MLRFLKLVFYVPPALLCAGVIRLLARFGIRVRYGEFWSERIGHLAGNTECYLCEKDAGKHPKSWDVWFHRGPPANVQLASMWRRSMTVDRTGFTRAVALCNGLFKGWEPYVAASTQVDRDIYNLYGQQKPHLKFTQKEEVEGWETMRKWGIPEGAKWVCLIVRDGAYLPSAKYHDYRNSDIETYWPACAALIERGYFVFRMGAKVEKAASNGIIDYATNGMRSDFMDIYLGAKCEFCISSGTGFDAIPVVFRRPICFVNYAPLEYLNTWVKSVAIWKHHIKDGKRISLNEIYESGAGQFMAAEQFIDAGITLEENSPEEIRDAVLEMLARVSAVNGWHRWDNDELDQQTKFWAGFPRSISPYNGQPLHGEIKMRIAHKFLCSYQG